MNSFVFNALFPFFFIYNKKEKDIKENDVHFFF